MVKSSLIGPAALLSVEPERLRADPELEVRHPGGPDVDDPGHHARAHSH